MYEVAKLVGMRSRNPTLAVDVLLLIGTDEEWR
jgi:hypothetical protein